MPYIHINPIGNTPEPDAPIRDTPEESFLQRAQVRNDHATFDNALKEMALTGRKPPGQEQPSPAEPAPSGGGLSSLTAEEFKKFWGQDFPAQVGGAALSTVKGLGEIPPQLLAGRFEAVRHTAQGVSDIAEWMDKNLPAGFVGTPEEQQLAAENRAKIRQLAGTEDEKAFSTEKMFGFGAEPEYWPGQLARGFSELMTGYKGPMAALSGLGLSRFIASPLAGGVAGFFAQDPKQLGLSNLLEKIPGAGPVFNQLATNPDDPAILNRLRHIADGVVGTAAAEGVTKLLHMGAKWAFARKAAATAAKAATPEAQAEAARIAAEAEHFIGQVDKGAVPGGPKFTISVAGEAPAAAVAPTTAEAAAAKLADVAGDVGPTVPGHVTAEAIRQTQKATGVAAIKAKKFSDVIVDIKWENIKAGDIPGLAGEIAQGMMGRLDAARRGPITLETQRKMADMLGMTEQQFLARGLGQAYNSEQLIASAKLFLSSEQRLYQLAHEALVPGASEAPGFLVNNQTVNHMALLEQFLGAQAEAGRALGAMRVVHQMGVVARAEWIKDFLATNGGVEGAKRLSQMLVDMQAGGAPPGAIGKVLQRSRGQWGWDFFKEGFGMGLLMKPVSHVRNIVGNVAMQVQHSADIKMAQKISTYMADGIDPKELVQSGEAMANLQGALASWRTGLEFAGKYVKTGNLPEKFYGATTPVEDAAAHTAAGLPGIAPKAGAAIRPPPLSAMAIGTDLMRKSQSEALAFTQTPFGKALDWLGSATRLPGRSLGGADMYFREMGYAGFIEQRAYRQALLEGAHPGTGEFADKVASYIANVPSDVHLAAVNHSSYMTFQQALGPWGKALMNFRSNFQPLFIALPYAKTPTNIFSVTMEHSPLAPAVKAWREDFAAGGERQAMALAKVATGSMMTAMLYDWAKNGHITGMGPKEPAYRESKMGKGWQPNSVHIGKYYFGISGMGQLAGPLGFAGAMQDTMERYDVHPQAYDTFDQLTGAAAAILAHSTIDQSMLQGISKVAQAIGASGRGEEGAWGTYIRDIIGSTVNVLPGVAQAKSIGSLMDPQPRMIADMWQAMIKNIVGLQSTLIPLRNAYGHEVEPKPAGTLGQIYNYVVPFKVSWDNEHPAFNEMDRLKMGITKPGWAAEFMGVPMNFRKYPEVLDYWRRLMGNELKLNPETLRGDQGGTKLSLEELHNKIVTGKAGIYSYQYKNLPDLGEIGTDSGKGSYLKMWANKYRHAAAEQIMVEAPWRFPDFYKEVVDGMRHSIEQRTPSYMQKTAPQLFEQKLRMMKPHQQPLPDRFGRPAVQPSPGGGTFSVPQGAKT